MCVVWYKFTAIFQFSKFFTAIFLIFFTKKTCIILNTLIMKSIDLKNKRKEHGFSQVKLAELIGVSERTIVNYENGEKIPKSKSAILQRILFGCEEKLNNFDLVGKEPKTDSDKISAMFKMIKDMHSDIQMIKLTIGLKETISIKKEKAKK